MRDFIEYLHDRGGGDLNAEEIADLLWLASQLPPPEDKDAHPYGFTGQDRGQDSSGDPIPTSQPASQKRVQAYLPGSQTEGGTGPGIASLPFRSPGVTALPQRLALGRALRPLKRTAPSPTRLVLDEAATVQRIADEGNWLPVLRPARERWLEVVILADESPSMTVWYALVGELQALLEQSGAFRTVQRWGFYADPERPAAVRFYAGSRFWEGSARYRSPAELNDPRGRRLILLVSDCISAAWRQPSLNRFLADWKDTPATLVQVLPERLWGRTGLRLGREAALRARQPGQPNASLLIQPRRLLDGDRLPAGFPLPVVTLEPETLGLWSQGLTAKGSAWMLGVLFPLQSGTPPAPSQPAAERPSPDAQRTLDAFRKTASEEAQRLARYLSAVPLNLPVMRMVQQVMFDEPHQSHLAEVLLSGLLQRRPGQERETHPDRVEYDFIDGARDLLRRAAGERELLIVLSRTSTFVDANTGLPVDFPTLLADPSRAGSLRIDEKSLPFAAVAIDILKYLGGLYADLAGILSTQIKRIAVQPIGASSTNSDLPFALHIRIIGPVGSITSHTLNSVITFVGRSPKCDLILDDARVSRTHLKIERIGAQMMITDLRSTNGTYLNNQRISPNTTISWATGQLVRVGNTHIEIQPAAIEEQTKVRLHPEPDSSFRSSGTIVIGQEVPISALTMLPNNPVVGFYIDKDNTYAVVPGQSIIVPVHVVNRGNKLVILQLKAENIPPRWISISEPQFKLGSGQRRIELILTPPKHPLSRTGNYKLKVSLAEMSSDGKDAQPEANRYVPLRVEPFGAFVSAINATQADHEMVIHLSIKNLGNRRETFAIYPWSNNKDTLNFTPLNKSIAIDSGQETWTQILVSPKKRAWIGTTRKHLITVQISAIQSASQFHTVEFLEKRRISLR